MDKIDISQLTEVQMREVMSDLNEKFKKLRNLATKIAAEMDDISEQYQTIIDEIEKRKANNQ